MKDKFILDACCGGRMMWFNKNHPNTLYIDNRQAIKGHINNKECKGHEVRPDIVMDFRDLKFSDGSFRLVVFDPPHLSTLTETSILRKKFGCLNAETWQADLKKAFSELWRVLEDYGVLIIKWNDIEISYKKLLALFTQKPLFMNITAGNKSLKSANHSYWFCFMKIPFNNSTNVQAQETTVIDGVH